MAALGVIGGMGPMATADFLRRITAMTDAACDQDHLPLCLCHAPQIPDRTAYILGRSDRSPLPGIVQAGLSLRAMGADLLAIPCVTAHYFHDEIERRTGLRVLHAIRLTADLLAAQGITRAAVLATRGTVAGGLFQKEFQKRGIAVILPDYDGQEVVSGIIFDQIKKGNPPDADAFWGVCRELAGRGAQRVILGCTELSLIGNERDKAGLPDCPDVPDVLDVLDVLAAAAITACGRPVREKYRRLILPVEEKL